MKYFGIYLSFSMASSMSRNTGIPFFTPSRYSPASIPALVLSVTPVISYFSECRHQPIGDLAIQLPQLTFTVYKCPLSVSGALQLILCTSLILLDPPGAQESRESRPSRPPWFLKAKPRKQTERQPSLFGSVLYVAEFTQDIRSLLERRQTR